MIRRIPGIILLLIFSALITGSQLIQSPMNGVVIQSTPMKKPAAVAIIDAIHTKRDYQAAGTVLYEPALYMIRPGTISLDVSIAENVSLKENFVFDFKNDAERHDPFGIELIVYWGDSFFLEALYEKPGISLFEDGRGLITLHGDPRETSFKDRAEVLIVGDF